MTAISEIGTDIIQILILLSGIYSRQQWIRWQEEICQNSTCVYDTLNLPYKSVKIPWKNKGNGASI